ncbi:MAG: hypothetical protein M3P82_04080, partial [Bacteroidota bacterium]|nr:hypothetical protein [Bacteroidota bacterium]
HYSYDGNNYEEKIMRLAEPNGDKNNSGKYSVSFTPSSNMDKIRFYFSAEDYSGNKSEWQKEVSSIE